MSSFVHDIFDASKVWAAGFLGWTITSSDLDVYLKIAIAFATLLYMIGKAIVVWRRVLDDKGND